MIPTPYSPEFYVTHSQGSKNSADVVVPVLMEIFAPESVADVGCGVGTWLAAFREHGAVDAVGFDGPWVPTEQLLIPAACFRAVDLSRPLVETRRYDVAVCLEVAEHLAPESAETLVESLVGLAPVVVFSAAIPHQGGSSHVNEQWPAYWSDLFERRGYVVVDCIRWRIWRDPSVDYWYSQNMLAFVAAGHLANRADLREVGAARTGAFDVVHPRMFLAAVEYFGGRLGGQESAPSQVGWWRRIGRRLKRGSCSPL